MIRICCGFIEIETKEECKIERKKKDLRGRVRDRDKEERCEIEEGRECKIEREKGARKRQRKNAR